LEQTGLSEKAFPLPSFDPWRTLAAPPTTFTAKQQPEGMRQSENAVYVEQVDINGMNSRLVGALALRHAMSDQLRTSTKAKAIIHDNRDSTLL
jgi:hypothetical protein